MAKLVAVCALFVFCSGVSAIDIAGYKTTYEVVTGEEP
jgi:hypothetical protein